MPRAAATRFSVDIPFPSGGVVSRLSYGQQPPNTTLNAVNLRPFCVGPSVSFDIEQRQCGGTRPGLVRNYTTRFGGINGAPLRLIHSMNLARGNDLHEWRDDFDTDAIQSTWSTATWLSETVAIDTLTGGGSTTATATVSGGHNLETGMEVTIAGATPTAFNGTFSIAVTSPTEFTYTLPSSQGAASGSPTFKRVVDLKLYPDDEENLVYNELAGAYVMDTDLKIDTDKPYSITIDCVPFETEHWGDYTIFAGLDDDTPDATQDGIVATLSLTGTSGAYTGSVKVYSGGSLNATYNMTGGSTSGVDTVAFKLTVSGTRVRAYVDGTEVLDQDTGVTPVGSRLGFGLEATETNGIVLVDSFLVQYYVQTGITSPLRQIILASAGGKLYREVVNLYSMEEVASNITLSSDKPLSAVSQGGVVYIADYSEDKIVGDDGSVSSSGKVLTATSIPDWGAFEINKDEDVLVVSNGQGNVVDGVYAIANVTQREITTVASMGGSGAATYRIAKAPVKYDPLTNTMSLWLSAAGKGSIPIGCPIIALYRDRVMLGGAEDAPAVWYMSRQGDPTDWDFSQTDAQSAVAGQNSDVGTIGDPLTAIVPFTDDYVAMASVSTLYVLRGDPFYGGQMDNASRAIGIVGRFAWCHGRTGELYFLSHDGLYVLPPRLGGPPQAISKERLPLAMQFPDVDRNKYQVFLEYDVRDVGVHIWIVDIVSEEPDPGEHWWYCVRTNSFWKVAYSSTDFEPTVTGAANNRWASDPPIMIGGRDGYIRTYRDVSPWDDLTTQQSITWEIEFGPFMLPGVVDSMMTEFCTVFGQYSSTALFEIRSGDSPEQAKNATPIVRGMLYPGKENTWRTRIRGKAFFIKITTNLADKPWYFERAYMMLEKLGRHRVGHISRIGANDA